MEQLEEVTQANPDDSVEASSGNRLPFTFAKRHGLILVDVDSDTPRLLYLPKVKLEAITEARRFLGRRFALEEITTEQFDGLLQQIYQSSTSDAMQMMGEVGDDMDLAHVAQHLPEPEDLLESEDDAPIIRLINALLT
ncbi:MAG: type II secretion system protein GspE, partial [Gammaproteobacteria bacterium]|nr:type II secretion system protein GspE [Gammaproteobacteria bacterium]